MLNDLGLLKAEYKRQDAVRHGGRTLQGRFFDGRVKTKDAVTYEGRLK